MSTDQGSVDIAIVGGGVIGLAIGWRAAQRGLRVVVLERGAPGCGTSRLAAGMIAPISEASLSEPDLLALGRASAAIYGAFVDELIETTGVDPLYRRFGTLLVARDLDEAQALERELAFRERLSLPVRRLLPSETRQLEPGLAPTLRLGLEIADDHAIDPRLLASALARAVELAGGSVRSGADVAEVLCEAGRVVGLRLRDGERVVAESVVIAAGPWSASLAGIPRDAVVPLRPVKGQILRLRDPAGPGLLSRVLRMQPGYVVPRGDGRYVLGATMEERGFDTTVTAGAIHDLLRDAIELLPGLGELVIEEIEAGIRPGTPDNAPVIGPGALAGLYWATGHHRNGILLTPITAELACAELAGEPRAELGAPFDPARFTPVSVGG
jgi:glycine oxidase